MHWSLILLFLYIVLSQHAFLTVFSDSSQLPAARAGDLGIFRLFSSGAGFMDLEILQALQANMDSLVPGAVVLYKTNESENGLKLATVLAGSPGDGGASDASRRKWHAVLHQDITLEDLEKRRYPEKAVFRELGIHLRRWSDACACGHKYQGQVRDFIKPVAEIHGVLFASVPYLGLPILLLHKLKVFLAGSGIAGGIVTLTWSLVAGQHVSLYDLDLDTRGTAKRSLFVWSCCILCTVLAYAVYTATVYLLGITSTTVVGVFSFLYAGLHDVALDFFTHVRERLEDEITSRVGGPAYFGWPVKGVGDKTYDDDLSYAHAQGDGLSTVVLLRGRILRYMAGLVGVSLPSPFLLEQAAHGDGPVAHQSSQHERDARRVAAQERGGREGISLEVLECSLVGGVMIDPVVAADGYTYERQEIEKYMARHTHSPKTGRPFAFKNLVRNNQLRNVIDAWRRDQSGSAWIQSAREELRCPITMSVMRDPVVTCDGHSYERSSIIQWLRRHGSSPKSNLPLSGKALITNHALRMLADCLAVYPSPAAVPPDACEHALSDTRTT